jgi:hypothetical protein
VQQQRLAFRSAVLPCVWIAVATVVLGTALGFTAVLLRDGPAVNWTVGGERLAWLAPAVFVAIVLGTLAYRVYVLEDGLRGYTGWGTYRTFRWPEINRVRPINLLGLRFLRVLSVQGGPALWVPLFLADMPGFRAAVRESTGEVHPLSRALDEATEPIDDVDEWNDKDDP